MVFSRSLQLIIAPCRVLVCAGIHVNSKCLASSAKKIRETFCGFRMRDEDYAAFRESDAYRTAG
jgi:hypothetical protein